MAEPPAALHLTRPKIGDQSKMTTSCSRPGPRALATASAAALLAVCAVPVQAAPGMTVGDIEIDLRGRLHFDAAYHDEDDVLLDDGLLNRRTRLGVAGKLHDWSVIVEYDFAENTTTAADVMLSRKLGAGAVNIGHFKVPMGLNELTSANHITFMERSAASNVVVDARRLGAGYDYFGENFTVQTMVFGRPIGGKETGDMPLGIAGRFTWSPEFDLGRLHLGISGAYESRQDYSTLRYRDRPESRVDGARLIDTGNLEDVNATTKIGLEAAFLSGPFSAEGEFFSLDVDLDEGADPSFTGYHLQMGYVLTGEARGYRNGVFRGITPDRRTGAWEVAARYGSVDLIDAGIQGGEQETLTLGVNYYPSSNVRFMANYIRVDVTDSTAVVGGENVPPAVVGDDSPNIFALRAQFHF
jgi:phosphate-selective porin OprO and OprP